MQTRGFVLRAQKVLILVTDDSSQSSRNPPSGCERMNCRAGGSSNSSPAPSDCCTASEAQRARDDAMTNPPMAGVVAPDKKEAEFISDLSSAAWMSALAFVYN